MSKHFLIALLVIEFIVALAVGGGTCLLRRDEQRAIRALYENPSEATRAEWNRQRGITLRSNTVLAGILFTIMATPTYLVYRQLGAHRSSTHENA